MHYEGKLYFANGDIYEGSFRDGKMSGPGTLTKLNGYHYEGSFMNDAYSGLGRET